MTPLDRQYGMGITLKGKRDDSFFEKQTITDQSMSNLKLDINNKSEIQGISQISLGSVVKTDNHQKSTANKKTDWYVDKLDEDMMHVRDRAEEIFWAIEAEVAKHGVNRKKIQPFLEFEETVQKNIEDAYEADKNSKLDLRHILEAVEDILKESETAILENEAREGLKSYNLEEFKVSLQLTEAKVVKDLSDGRVKSYVLKLIGDPKSVHLWNDRDQAKKKKQNKKAKLLRKETIAKEKNEVGKDKFYNSDNELETDDQAHRRVEKEALLRKMKNNSVEDSDDDQNTQTLGGIAALKQLAEYKARTTQEFVTADMIRKGQLGEDDLVAFLEKDSLVDLMQYQNDMLASDNEEKGIDQSHAALESIMPNRYNDN